MFYNDENLFRHAKISVEIKNKETPTHTEDGIPIRKLYVTNLPHKTTRSELFNVFAQFGFIKSCWLKTADKNIANQSPSFAFVTFTEPESAHNALEAPIREKMLKGRVLRIFPADSWHQPTEDPDGNVHWNRRRIRTECPTQNVAGESGSSSSGHQNNGEPSTSNSETTEEDNYSNTEYTILDILNSDCLNHIYSYVPIRDLIRSERVSKQWRDVVNEYIQGYRTFKTSWWPHNRVRMTTAVLRQLLARIGSSLTRLHVDHRWYALNDRTAHIIGKFCPNLEELKIVGMYTKNWNSIAYGCKNLKSLSFLSCSKLTDMNLINFVNSESSVERFTLTSNTHVTGLFLAGNDPRKIKYLSFNNCFCLQGSVLNAAMDTLPYLTTLKLDLCPVSMWKSIPLIISKLPQLEELSLSEYTAFEIVLNQSNEEKFCEALSKLTSLKHLNLSKNMFITNAVMKQIAKSCKELEILDVSSCNAKRSSMKGVGDEGVCAVCAGCSRLRALDVSYLSALSEAGAAAALRRAPALAQLTARGLPALRAGSLAAALLHCAELRELDACGCDNVTDDLLDSAVAALHAHPRPLLLRLAGTAVPDQDELPQHPLLTVNITDDLCEAQLRPDFVDYFVDSSDESFDDFLNDHHFEDMFEQSDDDFLDEEDLEDYEGIYGFGLELGADIIFL